MKRKRRKETVKISRKTPLLQQRDTLYMGYNIDRFGCLSVVYCGTWSECVEKKNNTYEEDAPNTLNVENFAGRNGFLI